ncbi:MAG: NAD-dependent epimerase/dehydratase family protein [Chloroflexota bacterium]
MSRILVTGGKGELGRELTPRLLKAGYTVRVMSRRAKSAELTANVEWALDDGPGDI